ncbi:glycosyltransferase family 39 protein [Magnetospira thiophila]
MRLPLSFPLAVAIVAALTVARIAGLFLSDLNLHGDEAQYWFWSTTPDWGYFSKPPMIGWLIAATSALGKGEAFVRLGAPLLHGATALLLYGVAASLYDRRAAFWTAMVYATLPAVSFSSALISTDVPLLFFWALALLALDRLLATRGRPWAVLLGLAIGLGLMSKYAMVYFLLGLGLYLVFTPSQRGLLRSLRLLEVLLIAGLCLLPNLLWNMDHHWVTAGHTASNANWTQAFSHPGKGLEFVGAQFGVFGPILLGALLIRLGRWRRDPLSEADRRLLFFSLPVLLLVTAQAFASRSHANWAATAYVAATPLVTAWLLRVGPRWLSLSTALHGLGVLAILVVFSGAVALPLKKDPLDKLRGWAEVGARVAAVSRPLHPTAILVHDRLLIGQLLYYLPDSPAPLRMWPGDAAIHNHYELTLPLTPDLGGRVFYLTEKGEDTSIPPLARRIAATGEMEIPLTSGTVRAFTWYLLEDLRKF